MVPPPSSIITNAELRRLDLLRHADRERLAASALGQPSSFAVLSTLGRITAAAVQKLLATIRLRPQCLSPRQFRRAGIAGSEPPRPANVTQREVEVLTLVAAGLRIT